jgi:hypothetical protein
MLLFESWIGHDPRLLRSSGWLQTMINKELQTEW